MIFVSHLLASKKLVRIEALTIIFNSVKIISIEYWTFAAASHSSSFCRIAASAFPRFLYANKSRQHHRIYLPHSSKFNNSINFSRIFFVFPFIFYLLLNLGEILSSISPFLYIYYIKILDKSQILVGDNSPSTNCADTLSSSVIQFSAICCVCCSSRMVALCIKSSMSTISLVFSRDVLR